jgi:hypothetical protein
MTLVEILGIFFYVKQSSHNNVVFKVLMGLSVAPATWFQLTILKWCIFVKKYVEIRDRRVRNLLLRLDQEEALNYLRQTNTLPPKLVLENFDKSAAKIEITNENISTFGEITCSICITEFQSSDQANKLVCGHLFHT